MPHCRIPSAARLASSVHATAAALAIGLCVLHPAALAAQTVTGAMGVSLTVVQAVSTVTPRFSTPSRATPAGSLSLDGSAPVSGPTSQIVMVALLNDDAPGATAVRLSLHTAAGDRTLTPGVAVPSTATGLLPGDASRDAFPISYRIRTGTRRADADPVALRIGYLAVPGT